MSLEKFFKAIVDSDNTSVVICDKNHAIVYMNPAACKSYEKYGGEDLVSKSILDCHNEHFADEIKREPA